MSALPRQLPTSAPDRGETCGCGAPADFIFRGEPYCARHLTHCKLRDQPLDARGECNGCQLEAQGRRLAYRGEGE